MTSFGVRVLLIEDDESKRISVQGCLERELKVMSTLFQIRIANSVSSAILELSSASFDLIVADMSLPTYDIEPREPGGTPRAFGGLEVFEHLERIESTTPVLVVTSYPVISDGNTSLSYGDLGSRLRSEFPQTFRQLIYFDSAYMEWDRAMTTFLKEWWGK